MWRVGGAGSGQHKDRYTSLLSVKLIDGNCWTLARQLNGDTGSLGVNEVCMLDLGVLLHSHVARITVEDSIKYLKIAIETG